MITHTHTTLKDLFLRNSHKASSTMKVGLEEFVCCFFSNRRK